MAFRFTITGLTSDTEIYLNKNNISKLPEMVFRPLLDLLSQGTGVLHLQGEQHLPHLDGKHPIMLTIFKWSMSFLNHYLSLASRLTCSPSSRKSHRVWLCVGLAGFRLEVPEECSWNLCGWNRHWKPDFELSYLSSRVCQPRRSVFLQARNSDHLECGQLSV